MNKNSRIDHLVQQLKLLEHPEGGYYREVYRSSEIILEESLPDRYVGNRSFATGIYYLIKGNFPSRFHRLKSDELWHFYEGSPVHVHIINPHGEYEVITMGNIGHENPNYQLTIEKNHWFGGIVTEPDSYTLLGCTVSPGFDFDDFEMADRDTLLSIYPEHEEIIRKLT